MDLYPINLNIKEKKVLIVGAGKVAFRKFERLLAAEAAIKVVSPNFNNLFSAYLNKKSDQYELIKRKFKKEDLNSVFLVFAATNNSNLNHKIALLAKEKNILINIVDNAEFSDFTLPAVINRGDLLLTVASGCNLPALSKKIRKELESKFGLEYQLLLEVMSKKRAYIISNIENNKLRKEIFNKIAADDFLNKVKIIINNYNLKQEAGINNLKESKYYSRAVRDIEKEITHLINQFN